MQNKIHCIICIGLPGSGKTTYIRNNIKDHFVISKDDIRKMFYSYYDYKEEDESLINSTQKAIIESAINYKKNIVIDETNITYLVRKDTVETIRAICEKNNIDADIEYLYFKESDLNVKRRLQDPKGLPPERWIHTISHLMLIRQVPGKQELEDLNISRLTIIGNI